MHARSLATLAATALGLLSAAALHAQSRPALVVLVTVDQLPSAYIARFAAQLTGGFRRLATEGSYFVTALHDHALTSTAPGHATLWSGRFPRNTNIISNDLGVPDPAYPLIAGFHGDGASPRRLRGTMLVDWLIRADSGTRVLSVSRKDRGAILSVGSAREPVFWWSSAGGFTTSTYYADSLPSWLRSWNARVRGTDWTAREWRPLLDASAYPEPDSMPHEGAAKRRGYAFPHRPHSNDELERFPWMDSLTLDVALHGARALRLGQRDGTDVLAVSLSTLDLIGHDFGPDSREVHDHFLRLDRWLGDFMARLERELAGKRILLVLSSDHGVTPIPELRAAQGHDAGRIELSAAVRPVVRPLQQRHRTDFDVRVQTGLVLADTAAMRARGIDVSQLAERLASAVRRLAGVERVFTPAELHDAPADHPTAALWRRAIPPGYGWLIAAEPRSGWGFSAQPQAEHGTPARANREVPVFFHGAGVPRQRITRPVRTVDVAPTIAALLGIVPTEPVDGVILREVTRQP